MAYTPQHKVRIVTAAALFDGHDAAINIMRRIMQAKGAEVIHLGHNRSAAEIVDCAIEEDAQGIAVTSYQGGHVEFFKYMYDLLQEKGCGHIKIFGGGGGTILPSEIEELHAYGIARLYSPDDGRQMGLEGMIEDLIRKCDVAVQPIPEMSPSVIPELQAHKNPKIIARAISLAESDLPVALLSQQKSATTVTVGGSDVVHLSTNETADKKHPVLGITGTGGAGKSSVTDELVRRYLNQFTDKTIAVISVDPSKKKTGGALLGDRIRMNSIHHPRAYMRSLATRESDKAISEHIQEAIDICKLASFDFIILETSGIGQSDTAITDYCDVSLYVMTPEYGAASQLEKINMLDYADVIAINKFDKAGALDALHDVRKQYKRNHNLWDAKEDSLPVVGSIASQFNDAGINQLFEQVINKVKEKTGVSFGPLAHETVKATSTKSQIIPPARVRYLAEITETIAEYGKWVDEQCKLATQLYQVEGVIAMAPEQASALADIKAHLEKAIHPECMKLIKDWPALVAKYKSEFYEFKVRDKVIKLPLYTESLSHTNIPKVSLPAYTGWGDILRWQLTENLPGEFPYAAGVFPLKREGEDPTRMFAGEGGPERTNKRFHYVSLEQPAKRLSTAFDSVTLYGEDPAIRPDIYGKIGNSGVSIATVDDAKKLYSGFDLCDPKTSVSMTINGPAPILLAFFMNAAIDQQCEKYIAENGLTEVVQERIRDKFKDFPLPIYNGALPAGNDGLGLKLLGVSGEDVLDKEVYDKIRAHALSTVRGTVQADILKEDQAQNTCIFSTEFALKLMGDVQEYFINQKVRNFYSVSISGYHIAEAGANPITQLAFTLANGFTYVEYYLSRGMHIDDFAPNLSFFFSNGMDPEYAVIGRVARRIWAKAIKYKYKGNDRSQKLKYHIQTSGRSLHAQEIDFNDIRTTLQALYAIYDNCNSLHTNAYDEAITTPTEESVRRAMAIQLIINRELGTAKNENPIQGSFFIEELTDLVEEAVLSEFNRITERGGVLGAMERMYQRNKIQEESLYYESLKHTGEYPIIGVNTFLNKNGSPTIIPAEVIRSTTGEKEFQIAALQAFHARHAAQSGAALKKLQQVAINNGNLFAELMETVRYCSLGQITNALYEVGGQYRRNM
ncbi:methylmalonyl-CoA mutase [Chitinophaga terrae (ex Kim and Jung 2007)]|uniref:Fused isobutyryl-CoA mutase n=1 Tax=Chitinophaga terrae (ex Kim and Jung 2007) TaxID=408074 RepID=A0A1H3XXF8_9BACT|nr:methylmalonyl-CoA mutase family protein [Chitinophaga terrae (ex Kim and Jung 2007)]GEP89426.1 Fused isobutyryl-CoA mutase [Chitinophaga terrae (ex Kim and Jung 2007)]SEA03541.1 methylmalonyl-CoA mutase [Chitinophaga terrae (ex Kim and Jung 2007)]